jgi:uncharacterized protein (DUF427 family)
MKAVFNGQVTAESDETVVVEGNPYFPPSSLKMDYFSEPTGHCTHCPWKGDAEYRDITVDGRTASNAAWSYPQPKEKAAEIAGHVAFYGVVDVS